MNYDKTGGPAFPSHGTMGEVAQEGMTLRDYFAAKAMLGLLCDPLGDRVAKGKPDNVAAYAYNLADAMMTARNA